MCHMTYKTDHHGLFICKLGRESSIPPSYMDYSNNLGVVFPRVVSSREGTTVDL